MKWYNGSMTLEFTALTKLPTLPKRLAWQDGGMAFCRLSYSASCMALARLRQGSPEGCLYSEPASNIWCCYSNSQIPRSRNQEVEMGATPLTITLAGKIFASCSHDFMLCWPRSLSSKGKNAPTRRYNNDSTELEVTTDIWPLSVPNVYEVTGTGGVTVLTRVTDPDCEKEIGYYSTMEVRKRMSEIQATPQGVL